MISVAIQGQAASFHDIAARQFFAEPIQTIDCDTFAATFDQLANGAADYAVVAVENSLYGTINPVYDLLLEHKTWVCGEVYLRIEHCLIGTPSSSLKDITEVHSQIMAIGQCEDWLGQKLPTSKHIEEHDTTASVVMVKEWNDPSKAAIASQQAAELHKMKILAKNIEDHHENFTRFFILSRTQGTHPEANKTSLILQTPGDTKPGSLYRALGTFADRDINMYALHARPMVGKAWHYLFYVDVGIGSHEQVFQDVMDELAAQNCTATILGSYKNTMN